MKINTARICLNCEEIYEPFFLEGIGNGEGIWITTCPSCTSKHHIHLSNFISTTLIDAPEFKWKEEECQSQKPQCK